MLDRRGEVENLERDLIPLRNKMFNIMVYDGWQFIQSAILSIRTAQFCSDVIGDIIKKYDKVYGDFHQDLLKKFADQKEKEGTNDVKIRQDDLPRPEITVEGTSCSGHFLINKLTKDFFQYIRNSFDYIAQIVNAVFLQNESMSLEQADFKAIKRQFEHRENLQKYIIIRNWFNRIALSDEYIYLDDFCNQTKHISDMYVKLGVSLFGEDSKVTLNPFLKKGSIHAAQNVKYYLKSIWQFVFREFANLLLLIEVEIDKMIPCEDRYHQLLGVQRNNEKTPDRNYAFVYVETQDNDINRMPEEIGVLLAIQKSISGDVEACNCSIDNIYICNSDNCLDVIGVYNALDNKVYTQLLYYRKYKKVIPSLGDIPLIDQIKQKKHTMKLYPNQYIQYCEVGV